MTIHPNGVVVYLQTQSNLDALSKAFSALMAVNLSSFHFGYNADGSPYIHLNDTDPAKETIWPLMAQAQKSGVKAIAMLGGAGGAYDRLFNDYETFYPMWRNMLKTYNLDGVDLDVEEAATLTNIKKFITDLRTDFPDNFYITSAPVAMSLQTGSDPFVNFDWRDIADLIDWFNVQFYDGWGSLRTPDQYNAIINRGFKPIQILAGMLTNASNGGGYVDMAGVAQTLNALYQKYGDTFGGAMGWEWFNANNSKEQVDPVAWANDVKLAVGG